MLLVEDQLKAAQVHCEAGRYDNAALICESVLDMAPGHPAALQKLIEVRLELGELEAAQELVRRATARSLRDPDFLCQCAAVFRLSEALADAEAMIDQALALDPDHVEATIAKADHMVGAGKLSEAEDLLSRIQRLNPANAAVVRAMAQLYSAYGLFRPALELAQDALSMAPKAVEMKALVGEILANLGDSGKAEPFLEDAYLAEPSNPLYMIALANNYLAQGQLTAALRLAKRCVSLFPNLLAAWQIYVRVMIEKGEGRAAFTEFLPVVKRNPNRVDATLSLALAYRQAGLPTQALHLLQPLEKQAERITPEQRRQTMSMVRDCNLSLGRIEAVTSSLADNALPQVLELSNAECADNEVLSAVLDRAGFILDAGVTNLEAMALLRFVSPLSKGREAVVAGPSSLEQLARLYGNMAYVPNDLGFDVGSEVSMPPVSIPASILLAFPEKLRGGRCGSGSYLTPEPGRVAKWRRALEAFPKPWVGLAWNSARPGLLLEDMASLRDLLPGTMISVMWDAPRRQLKSVKGVIDAGAHFEALADLAALVSLLDIMIGPDGVALHLAGAIGTPGVVICKPSCPWYWYAENETALWYPSVGVARAEHFGNWADIMGAYVSQVAAMAQAQLSQRGE